MNTLGPLLSIIIATMAVYITKVDEKYAVKVVGSIKKGLNPSSLNNLKFGNGFGKDALRVGIVVGLVALTVCAQLCTK